MKDALRAVVAALMLVWMLIVLAGLAALSVLIFGTLVVVAILAGGTWAVGAGIAVAAMFAVLGAGLVGLRRRNRRAEVGVSIANDVQPLFWVEIYRVAEGLGTRSPDEVLLFSDATVSVSRQRTTFGLRPGARRLHLGLPLLAGLTERELRAVIAHAFYRSWGPSSLGRFIHRGRVILAVVADRVGETSVVARIVRWYGDKYVAMSLPVTRRYELRTDRVCADFAGNNATAAALAEAAVLSRGWAAFVEGYGQLATAAGLRPDDVFSGFSSYLQEPGRRQQLAEPAEESTAQWRGAGDGHLQLADRLAAIALLPEDDIHDSSGPALGLMRYPDQIIREVEESMFGGSVVVGAAWEDIVPEAARAAACADALQLAQLAEQGGLGPNLSVAALLELIGFGLVDEVVRPILPVGSPDIGRKMAARLVTGYFATAAIESGTASYRFNWAAPRRLVDEQGAVDDLPLIVEAALAEENDIAALELWLTAHRVGSELELGAHSGQSTPEVGPADSPADSTGEEDVPADSPADSAGDEDGPADSPTDSAGDRAAAEADQGPAESPRGSSGEDRRSLLVPKSRAST